MKASYWVVFALAVVAVTVAVVRPSILADNEREKRLAQEQAQQKHDFEQVFGVSSDETVAAKDAIETFFLDTSNQAAHMKQLREDGRPYDDVEGMKELVWVLEKHQEQRRKRLLTAEKIANTLGFTPLKELTVAGCHCF